VSDSLNLRFRDAQKLQEAGRVDDAIRAYQAILAVDSDHVDSLHMLGIALARTGQRESGARMMMRANSLRPDDPAILMNLGSASRDLGRLAEALDHFAQVTRLKPDYAPAFRARGMVLVALGRAEEALAFLGQAVRLRPEDADANCDLGVGLDAAGRKQMALQCFDRAVAFNPGHAHAHHNRAILLAASGRHAEALESYDRAVALQPNNAAAHSNRGSLLHSLGRYRDALASFDRALALDPSLRTAWHNRGLVLGMLGERTEALSSFNRALEIEPDNATTHFERGKVLVTLNRPAEALASYERALARAPDDFQTLLHHAEALQLLDRHAEAIVDLDRATAIDPASWVAHNNRGVALDRVGREPEALESFARAIALNNSSAMPHTNAGNVSKALRRYSDAGLSFDRALAIDPEDAVAAWSQAHLKLLLGDFRGGWPLYDARFRVKALSAPARIMREPRWRGVEAVAGRRLLVHAEEGLGDTIQFCRYIAQVKSRGASVVFEVQAPLKRLLGTLTFGGRLIARGEPVGPIDLETPLLSLPAALGADLATVPRDVPYLAAEPERIKFWASRVGGGARFKVGIAWQGNVEAERRVSSRPRSVPLAAFAPLAAMPEVRLVSLQKGLGREQLPGVNFAGQIVDLGEDFDHGSDAFIDTAAVMMNLDLVVTSDTSIAHLAGALGRPVWTVLSENPDWRWLTERDDSPWYPTMRLFRMPIGGKWSELLESVAAALRSKISGSGVRKK
jgi:tetratricopeptide (TPR) repeat protein